jgi:hypothetical protein
LRRQRIYQEYDYEEIESIQGPSQKPGRDGVHRTGADISR